MFCIECFKKGKPAKPASFVYFGKSVCRDCMPEALRGGGEFKEALTKLQDLMEKSASESMAASEKINALAGQIIKRQSG